MFYFFIPAAVTILSSSSVWKVKCLSKHQSPAKPLYVLKLGALLVDSQPAKAHRNNLVYSRENIVMIVTNPDICLGLAEGEITLDEVGMLMSLVDELQNYLPDVEIDNLNRIIDNAMTKNSAG